MHSRSVRWPALLLAASACALHSTGPTSTVKDAAPAPAPPVAAQKAHVQVWHGEPVNDPWYWLREKENPEVRRYLEAENAYTAAVTKPLLPFVDALYREMLGRIQQTDLSVPERRGKFYYYERTVEGLQYPIRCRRAATAELRDDPNAPEEVLLDQNDLAQGHAYLGVHAHAPSDDGARLLYTTDTTGFRQYRLFVRDLATGRVEGPLAERVDDAEWAADGRTIFFTTEDPVTKRADTLWWLAPGAAPVALYREADELFSLELSRTRDHAYLVLRARSTDTWESRILRADAPQGAFHVVLPRQKGHKYEVEHRAGRLYLRTNLGAKDFRIVTAPVDDAGPARWASFVDARPGVLVKNLVLFRSFAVVIASEGGTQRVEVHDFASGGWRTLAFPEPVFTVMPSPNPEFDTALFRYTYQSFTTPKSVFEEHLGERRRTLLKEQPVLGGYDRTAYVSERLWVTARDGTRVPVSLVQRKGVPRDGSAPLWLYGYGSYGYGVPVTFDARRISLLDRGVTYAIAHVRGGDELGEGWHHDGMLMRKKNTFHDFVDVAEALVRQRWASPPRLLIEGESAGGLLMGAVVNERPDLFRAVHAAVPFVDLMNTSMDPTIPLTVGEYLEWGDPNQKPAFDYMRSYSPYDNLGRRAYPALLVTSSFNDSEVMYWEPTKYVAKLRTLKTDDRPLLLRMKLDPAGHGGASGRYDALRDRAFEVAWMLSQVGITR